MMTQNGISTTTELGTENYETFWTRIGRTRRRLVQYDYRHFDGSLFSTVKASVELCRASRDEWLAKNFPLQNEFMR